MSMMTLMGNFLRALQRTLGEARSDNTLVQYDALLVRLGEHPYDRTMLPEPGAMGEYLSGGPAAVQTALPLLYTELYYRHLHQHWTSVPLAARIASYRNYEALFAFLADPAKGGRAHGLPVALPAHWCWDLLAEFVYQFGDYAAYRARLAASAETAVLETDAAARAAWAVPGVLAVLQQLADPARCHELGHYALVGLCRVYCAICDYSSVVALAPRIDLQHRVYSANPVCHVTLVHRVGFAYMMLRRYGDAVRTFVRLLGYLARGARPARAQPVVTKKIDQIYALLAIAHSLAPQRIPEAVTAGLRERYGPKINQLQGGSVAATEELFIFACPRFVPGALPPPRTQSTAPSDSAAGAATIPARKQLQLFLRGAARQQTASVLRSYLKLYTTISLAKLAEFVHEDPESVRRELMCLTTNTHVLRDGSWSSTADITIYIENDMVHVVENKHARRYADYFLRLLQQPTMA